MRCKFNKFLYWLIPVRRWQAFLIKKHISGCSQCQEEIEDATDLIKKIPAIPDWIKGEENLWPQIKKKIQAQEEKALKTERKFGLFPLRKWRWAVVFLILAIGIGLSLLIHQNFLRKTSKEKRYFTEENPRIKIKYAEIKGKKAKPYIYQTPTASFIWFSEQNEGRE